MKSRQRLPGPFRSVAEGTQVGAMREVFPEVHPRVEVVEDEVRLPDEPGDRPGDQQSLRYRRFVQPFRRLEVGFRCGLRCVQPPREGPRLRLPSIVARDS